MSKGVLMLGGLRHVSTKGWSMRENEGTTNKRPLNISDLMRANDLANVAETQNALNSALEGVGSTNALAGLAEEATLHGKAIREAMGFSAMAGNILADMSARDKAMQDAMRLNGLGANALPGFAEQASAHEEAMRDAMGLSDLATNNALAGFAEQATAHEKAVQEAMRLSSLGTNALAGYESVEKRMNDLLGASGRDSALGKIANDIAAQKRTLDSWETRSLDVDRLAGAQPIHIPELRIPQNPLVETNKRLARIESQFELISEVARESSQTAVGLQASAAEFLQKFEKAADDTNKSGSKAMLVALIAVLITIFQTVSPYVLPDGDAAALRQTVSDLQGEISSMRADQSESSQRLLEALATGNHETAAAVRQAVEAALAAQPTDPEAVGSSATE